MIFIEILIGGIIAAAVLFSFWKAKDENRLKFIFAGSLIVAAIIYVAFALVGIPLETATTNWLLVEFLGVLIYTLFAFAGVKISAWFLSIGWIAHILWDVLLHFSDNVLFVPGFYPSVCIGFDLVFGVYIAYRFYFRD